MLERIHQVWQGEPGQDLTEARCSLFGGSSSGGFDEDSSARDQRCLFKRGDEPDDKHLKLKGSARGRSNGTALRRGIIATSSNLGRGGNIDAAVARGAKGGG